MNYLTVLSLNRQLNISPQMRQIQILNVCRQLATECLFFKQINFYHYFNWFLAGVNLTALIALLTTAIECHNHNHVILLVLEGLRERV